MATLGYVTVGTNDAEKAKAFYDKLLTDTGFEAAFDHPSGGRIYRNGPDMFAVLGPHNGEPATVGNGSMVGFGCDSFEDVDKLHAKALELGGVDEGAPGERMPGMYFSYFRDLDGNKLCIYCIKA